MTLNESRRELLYRKNSKCFLLESQLVWDPLQLTVIKEIYVSCKNQKNSFFFVSKDGGTKENVFLERDHIISICSTFSFKLHYANALNVSSSSSEKFLLLVQCSTCSVSYKKQFICFVHTYSYSMNPFNWRNNGSNRVHEPPGCMANTSRTHDALSRLLILGKMYSNVRLAKQGVYSAWNQISLLY